jgi:hypothetical protein
VNDNTNGGREARGERCREYQQRFDSPCGSTDHDDSFLRHTLMLSHPLGVRGRFTRPPHTQRGPPTNAGEPFISRVRPAVCNVESVVGLRERPTGPVRRRDAILG